MLSISLLSTFFVLSSSTPLFFNIWFSIFTGILSFLLLNSSSSPLTLYLVEESLSFLMMILWTLSSGGLLLSALLLIKSALSPFHQWFISVLFSCNNKTLIWSLTFHKLPVMCLISSFSFPFFCNLLIISISSGTLFMLSLSSVNNMLILSSSNTLASIFLILSFTPIFSFFFFILYSLLLITCLASYKSSVNSTFLFLGFMGLPPLLFFQIKWEVVKLLWEANFFYSVIFSIFSGISSIIYTRFILFMDLEFSFKSDNTIFFIWLPISILLPAL